MTTFRCGDFYVRPNRMSKGQVIDGHAHRFNHTSWIYSGAVRIVAHKDEKAIWDKIHTAPDFVHILAGVKHEITALQDNTELLCFYPPRDPENGEVVAEWNGWEEAFG